MIHFVAKDGMKALCQYYVALQRLQEQIGTELSVASDAVTSGLSTEKNVLIRLVANQVHDSLVVSNTILSHFIIQSQKDSKLYALVDLKQDSVAGETDSDEPYTSIQHFFANHYNQLLTILARWDTDPS